jgi:alkylhydroperoxidase family enzyme
VYGGIDRQVLEAILADYRTAPIDARLRGTLAFLDKLTRTPDAVTEADLAEARAAGVSDEALQEAVQVCFLFRVIDRLADALDFKLPTERSLRWVGRILLKVGYTIGAVPG